MIVHLIYPLLWSMYTLYLIDAITIPPAESAHRRTGGLGNEERLLRQIDFARGVGKQGCQMAKLDPEGPNSYDLKIWL